MILCLSKEFSARTSRELQPKTVSSRKLWKFLGVLQREDLRCVLQINTRKVSTTNRAMLNATYLLGESVSLKEKALLQNKPPNDCGFCIARSRIVSLDESGSWTCRSIQ